MDAAQEHQRASHLGALVEVFKEQLKLHIIDDVAQRREKMPIIEFHVTSAAVPQG